MALNPIMALAVLASLLVAGAAHAAPDATALADTPSLLPDAITVAKDAAHRQAALDGQVLPDLAVEASPDLATALARLGAPDALLRASPWSPAQEAALTRVVDAYLLFGATTDAVFTAAADEGRLPTTEFAPTLGARNVLLDAVGDLALAFPTAAAASGSHDVDEPGLIAVDASACGDSVYDADYVLIIDVCGNDTYNNNAGGTFNPLDPPCARTEFLNDPVQVHQGFAVSAALVDLGGSDAYGDGTRNCGANGGGTLGAGFLLDAGAGTDEYRAGFVAVNGGGHFGVGFLLDVQGDGTYSAVGQGANGGGYVAGHGTLIDLGGSDTYTMSGTGGVEGKAANGGGFLAGTGFLLDVGGSDSFNDGETFVCTAAVCTMAPPLEDGVGFRIDA